LITAILFTTASQKMYMVLTAIRIYVSCTLRPSTTLDRDRSNVCERGGRFQKSSVEGVQRPLTASTRKIFETLPAFAHVRSRSTALTHTTRT